MTATQPRLPILTFLASHGLENAVRHIEHGLEGKPEISLILTHPKKSAALGFVAGCAIGLGLEPGIIGRAALEIASGIGGALAVRYAIPAVGLLLAYTDSAFGIDKLYRRAKPSQNQL